MLQLRYVLAFIVGLLVSQACAGALLADTLVLSDSSEASENGFYDTHLLDTIRENKLSVITKKVTAEEAIELADLNGNILYKNLLILPNKAKKLASNIDQDTLISFANNGGNVVIVSDDSGTQLDCTLFLNQLGIYPSPKGYKYTDFHADSSDIIAKPTDFINKYVISNEETEVALENPAIALISNSEYLVPLLQTSRTSLSTTSEDVLSDATVWHTGKQGYAAVSFQGLNNGRITWIGSASPFKDASFNREFVNDIIQWTFQLKSVIKATFFEHKRVNDAGEELPFVDEDDYYKVKDYAHYTIGLSQYDLVSDSWIPFHADDNVQLEFVMLDPYQRLNLDHTSDTNTEGIYTKQFQIPDQHGMFTFKVDYKRPGLSYVTVEDVVPVRHLANDEYARSWEITNSYVYMAGYFVVVVAWLMFITFFMLSGDRTNAVGQEKKDI